MTAVRILQARWPNGSRENQTKSELFIMRSIAVMELRLRQGFAPRDLSIFFSQMLICNLILRKFQNCLNISPNTESCLDTARLASTDSCAFSTPRDGMF